MPASTSSRSTLSFALALALIASSPAAESPPNRTPFAARPDEGVRQLKREAGYDSYLETSNLEQWMRQMTTRPHHAGSAKAKENAEFIAGLFRSWGYQTEIEVFHVLFPTPRTRELQLLRPYPIKLPLTEQIVGTDPVSEALRAEALPPFNIYSADGEVTGPLVYVNRGLPEDYEVLERFGIEVKGKIVIVRYGGSWRGIKPKVAHEKGAIGCIIFNDPGDDGYTQGSAYPDGAFKHDSAVQRGSVLDMPVRPGDPLTPFRGATRDAERLTRDQAETIMKIPVLPISSVDGEKLLRALAKYCGRLTLRLADAEVLPFDFRGSAETYGRYMAEILKLADDLRKQTQETNRHLDEGLLKLAADPTLPFVAPKPKAPVPFLNFAPLQNAIDGLKSAAGDYDRALNASLKSSGRLDHAVLQTLNRTLFQSERALLNDKGLPRRPWFRHQIYAPGFYTGYGVKTLPGVREGIEQRQWQETEEQIHQLSEALVRYTSAIREAARLLKATNTTAHR
jgi:hypothetical protein